MSKVFISYSRHSGTVATGLAGDIEALGHTVWLDKELSGGQSWWDRILSTIRDCDVFVMLLDSQSLDSTACRREYGYAAALGKAILPVLTADGISMHLLPSALSQIQFVDYRSRDRDAVLQLARAFTSLPAVKPLPDPLPPLPEVPLSYLGGLGERVDKASTLTYEEQSALIVDLRRSTRDPETRDDGVTLLRRLRKRRDLLAAVADEIDEVLGSLRSTAQESRVVHELPQPAQESPNPPDKPQASTPVAIPEPRAPSDHRPRIRRGSRLKGAGIAAFVGAVLVAFSIFLGGDYATQREWLSISLGFGGIPWAVGGAIAAMRPGVIRIAVLTAGAGFVLGSGIAATIADRDIFVLGMVFGAGAGQLVGAAAGAIRNRKSHSTGSLVES